MRAFLRSVLARAHRALLAPPNLRAENRFLKDALNQLTDKAMVEMEKREAREKLSELAEAFSMAGTGPWREQPRATQSAMVKVSEALGLRETTPLISQGAYGDIELALQNVEWRREVNLSWLEFSRWGIQQIILISRLYYIKNPLIQRGINVAAHYVFGRGVEISSSDETANEVLQEFQERNQRVLGQAALGDLQRRLYYDGQIFFVLFSDAVNNGKTTIRTIDATEIQDIICNPDDADEPWFYHRRWVQKSFNETSGVTDTMQRDEWYPALNYKTKSQPTLINGKQVNWNAPVIHMKGGTGVSKWHFDTPRVYAALDWARASKRFLEACATVKQSLAQISMLLTTKGGQQALAGAKQQLETTVGPSNSLWDENPTSVNASIFASGPGTTLEAFKTTGAGGDPEEVRRFIHMVAMALDLPEHFFADVTTGALATAQTLDRPTELAFQEKQERWREVLVRICTCVLETNRGAASGRLYESLPNAVIREAARKLSSDRRRIVYEAAQLPKANEILVRVSFPAIREGDLPALVAATVQSMTLGTKAGDIIGIDEKEGVRLLFELLGVEDGDERVEEMFPKSSYDPDRTKEPEPQPVAPPVGLAPGIPPVQKPNGQMAESQKKNGPPR